MKKSKMILGLSMLIAVTAFNSYITTVSAQEDGKCRPVVKNVYFVDSGQVVEEVHPGSNGGNGYQLNILGTDVDNLEVVQEQYMTSLNVIPNYTSATAAKWQIFFAAKMGRVISHVRLKNKCTGKITVNRLDSRIRLLDQ